jgi:hypothetical protein
MIYGTLTYFGVLGCITYRWFPGTPWPAYSFSMQEPAALGISFVGVLYPIYFERLILNEDY